MKLRFGRSTELLLGLSLVALVAVFGGFRPISESLNRPDPIIVEKLTGEYEAGNEKGTFLGQTVSSRPFEQTRLAAVLGQTSLPKRIEVDLTNQRVYAFEGDRKVYEFLVSTGKWGRTPTGNFAIWGKSRYQKMSGGMGSTYYYLPNVPFIMWFAGDGVAASRGFSLHGTYWHNNFGNPMSHGCVNMRTEDAETLFYWSDPAVSEAKVVKATKDNPGTKITIYGETPQD